MTSNLADLKALAERESITAAELARLRTLTLQQSHTDDDVQTMALLAGRALDALVAREQEVARLREALDGPCQ